MNGESVRNWNLVVFINFKELGGICSETEENQKQQVTWPRFNCGSRQYNSRTTSSCLVPTHV